MYKVLIAEDELFVRLGIKNSIPWEKYDMQVVCDAENGKTAWEKIQKYEPDIILTDIRMPEMDGRQLVERIRETLLDPYIIVITCLEDFELVKNLLSLGIKDYILKATMTEEEIGKCLKKAQLSLQKSLLGSHGAAGFVSKSELCNQAARSYFDGRTELPELLSVLKPNHIHLEGRPLALALCPIEAVYDSEENRLPAPSQDICRNLFDLLYNRAFGDCTHYTFFLQEDCFVLLLCGEPGSPAPKMQALALDIFQRILDDIQDFLHIRVSFLTVLVENGPAGLRDAYRQALEMQKRHYLDGMGTVVPGWADRAHGQLEAAAAQLSKHGGWIASGLGRAAAEQYGRLTGELLENALKSQEEMTYGLMAVSHWVGALFKGHLEDEQQQCDRLLLKYPYLPEGVSALGVLLESGGQYHLQHRKSHYRQEVEDALRLIDEQLERPEFSLSCAAEHVGLSEAYFSTLFRQELGQTFVKYLTGARIERAKALLKQTKLKIFDVATRTGFSDEAYFSRVFKKAAGVSPSEWRALWDL